MLRNLHRPARLVVNPARRVASALKYYVTGLAKRLFSSPAPLWAQAIAFKVLVTLLPLVILATGVLGSWLRQANPFETVAGYLRSFLPPTQSEPLVELLFQLQKASGTLTLVGVAGLAVAAISLFSTLRYVIGQAMGADRHTERDLLPGYAFDARMAAQVGLLFLLSFGLTFAANVLSVYTVAWATDFGLDPSLLQRAWRFAFRLLTLLVPYVISVGMFTQLFYFVPRPRPPLQSAFVGALVTALLFEAAKNAFTLYARYLGNFDRYAAGPGDTLGGLFGLILGFVFWVYLSGMVLIIGTMVVALHEGRHTPRRRTVAQWITRRLRRRQAEVAAPEPSNPNAEMADAEAAGDVQEEPRPPDGDPDPDVTPAGDGAASPASPAGAEPSAEPR